MFGEQKIIQRRPAISVATIAPYFSFRRIKIINQQVLADASESRIWAQPSKRYRPVCHGYGQKACAVHSWAERTVRDLNMASARVWIRCRYRKLFCSRCQGVRIEDLQLFHPYLRVTERMARYVYLLCHMMTVSEVALGGGPKKLDNVLSSGSIRK